MTRKKQKIGDGKRIPKTMIFKVDTSPETMKKAREMFKDIDHIKLPYSGVKLQKMAQKERKITPL